MTGPSDAEQNAGLEATSDAGLRAMARALTSAPDVQLLQIAAVVDLLTDRSPEHDILAPVRSRLRPLNPPHPLTLSRLLVTPLQPLLVDVTGWRPGAVTIPRSAIRPLAAVAVAGQPDLAARMETIVDGATTHDAARIAEAGAILWPHAAAALRASPSPPPEWRLAGLPEKAYPDLAAATAECLALAPSLAAAGDPTVTQSQIDLQHSAALRQASPVARGMVHALLLCSVARAQVPREILLRQCAGAATRPETAAVLTHVWAWIEDALTGAPVDLAEVASGLHLRIGLLQALAADKAFRARAGLLQADFRRTYVRHLAEVARTRIVAPLQALKQPPNNAAMMELEADARNMRRLALALRTLGAGAEAEAVLKQAAQAAVSMATLEPVDKARLVELLDDSEAASRLPGL